MINKFQAGGAAPQGSILQEIAKLPQEQQKKIMTAFGKWAQSKGLNIQQLQGNEQALEQAMGQFLQEMQASQAPKARLGAKLNYIRSLKGNAPEGMEVEYYKCGGQTKKRFVKAAGGEKVKDGKKEIEDFKKKKACGGSKMKFQPGGKTASDTIGRIADATGSNGGFRKASNAKKSSKETPKKKTTKEGWDKHGNYIVTRKGMQEREKQLASNKTEEETTPPRINRGIGKNKNGGFFPIFRVGRPF